VTAPPAPVPTSPDWIRDAIHQARAELRLFFATALGFARAPKQFAAEWATGQRRALNPLGFLATAAAVLGGARSLVGRVVHFGDAAPTMAGEILDAAGPYVHYAALGVITHLVLRASGSRTPLRAAVAVSLFAGGGPAALCQLALLFALVPLHYIIAERVSMIALSALTTISFTAYSSTFAAGLAGLGHGRRWWWRLLGLLTAYLVTGVLFGLLHPPGSYGLHCVIGLKHVLSGGSFEFGLGL
jgi:hypothetical protein